MIFEFIEYPNWISPKGTNCPLNDIIKTQNECKVAAGKMGLVYREDLKAAHSTRPAGCYSYGYTSDSTDVGFNTITDPTSTSNLGELAGLCESSTIMKLIISYLKIYTL